MSAQMLPPGCYTGQGDRFITINGGRYSATPGGVISAASGDVAQLQALGFIPFGTGTNVGSGTSANRVPGAVATHAGCTFSDSDYGTLTFDGVAWRDSNGVAR